MSTIRFASPQATPQVIVGSTVLDEDRAALTEDELQTAVRFYHPGSATDLQLFEVNLEPNRVTRQHAHHEAEIIFVVEGELIVGSHVLGPRSSAMIPANTLYGFRSGANGATFLNFRARDDRSYIDKAKFMSQRASKKASGFDAADDGTGE